ncbi:aconitase family protein [Roseovarius nanhaiticus]|uniref:cis-3-hydroxy-L-proline dehydratase n=1 Tax=Roseovarius nanhaiticus TaxID=573024 RepID=UPI00248F5D5B|nr:aconitase family protein [Roseovarius nanhaiticus]
MGQIIVAADASGPVLASAEGLSFWGGVDAATGRVIDAHHPLHGESLAGTILMLPTSRGSCTGSGVLLELALGGNAPAALVFREEEDILTLGALIAGRMFDVPLAVLRLSAEEWDQLASAERATITGARLISGDWALDLAPPPTAALELSETDRAMLTGAHGAAAKLAMDVICTMAAGQGATRLTDVTRAHIDGCIYASPANLTFARRMADMGARVRVPTTMNAISVDHANWRAQGVPALFGTPAQKLADAYVEMGAQPSFTCAPYLLQAPPALGEMIGWSESNAVIYANSVLGARTVKHPDFMDLFIALTGRAPLSGVYLDAGRRACRAVHVDLPAGHDDALWPLLGWLVGRAAPDRIPLITGLEGTAPTPDDLKALCAAFGTTSAAPMLHVAGVTPEAEGALRPDADAVRIGAADLAAAWRQFNDAPAGVDLIAFGSPHFSLPECHALDAALAGRRRADGTAVIATVGQQVLDAIRADGTLTRLEASGVQVVPDICWCSISEPVFPPSAKVLMTNSGKYAHYAPGLSGRKVRFGSLTDCAEAAVTGIAPDHPPAWLT